MFGSRTIIGIQVAVVGLVMVIGVGIGYAIKQINRNIASADAPLTLDATTRAKIDSASSDALQDFAKQIVIKQYGMRIPLGVGLSSDLDCDAADTSIKDYNALQSLSGAEITAAINGATCANLKTYLTAVKTAGYSMVTDDIVSSFWQDVRDGVYGISTVPSTATSPALTRPTGFAGYDVTSTYFLTSLIKRLNTILYDTTVNTTAHTYLTSGFSVVGGRVGVKAYAKNPPVLADLTYDFNCDGAINNADLNVISEYWRSGTTIDAALITSTTARCKILGEYLGGLLQRGVTQVPIEEVTRIGAVISSQNSTVKPIVPAKLTYTACVDGKDYVSFNGVTATASHVQYQTINNAGNCAGILRDADNNSESFKLSEAVGHPEQKADYVGSWSMCKKAKISSIKRGSKLISNTNMVSLTKAAASSANERWSLSNNFVEVNMNDAVKMPFTIYFEDGGSGAALYQVSIDCVEYDNTQLKSYADYYRVEFFDPVVVDGRFLAYSQYSLTAPVPIQQQCQASKYYSYTSKVAPKYIIFDKDFKSIRVIDLSKYTVYSEAVTRVQADSARSRLSCVGTGIILNNLLLPNTRVNTY